MPKVTLDNVEGGYASPTVLNANFTALETVINDNMMSRDGVEGNPNHMNVNLDMNSNRITNLPDAATAGEPVTRRQLVAASTPTSFEATLSNYDRDVSGSSSRTVKDKLDDVISVKDFGAIGDGATNDTSAINSCISYLSSRGGGTLYFPMGTYNVDGLSTINFNNIAIVGDGPSSVLSNTGTGVTLYIEGSVGDYRTNILVENLHLTGSSSASHGLRLRNTNSNVTVRNVRVSNHGGNGFDFEGCVAVRTDKITSQGNTGWGMSLYEGTSPSVTACYYNEIDGTFISNEAGGVEVKGVLDRDNVFSNKFSPTCRFESNNSLPSAGVGVHIKAAVNTTVKGYFSDHKSAHVIIDNYASAGSSLSTFLTDIKFSTGSVIQGADVILYNCNQTHLSDIQFGTGQTGGYAVQETGTGSYLYYGPNRNMTRTGSGISNVCGFVGAGNDYSFQAQGYLRSNGTVKREREVTDNYTVNSQTEDTITLGESATANKTVTLDPLANFIDGTVLTFANLNATYSLTIQADGTENINGANTFVLDGQFDSVTIQKKSDRWIILHKVISSGLLVLSKGQFTVTSGTNSYDVIDSAVTASSTIMLSGANNNVDGQANNNTGLYVSAQTPGVLFTVSTSSGGNLTADVIYNYIIVG